ncbi:hypothetical protein Pcinc_033390 [Petrolisthes cinctipes]|uniref:Uncharacterized protein n=1 Tax=Petrolisthes cinctipes TaxID=88211 RepID=A0AAE1ESI5_PETCI|nr:hypothetical protein Pcinc_033390 [Petrolisthes cinctipes]
MPTLETMWEPHNMSEKNRIVFRDLCQMFERSPGVFQCKHRLTSDGPTISRKEHISNDSSPHDTQKIERSPRKRVNLDKTDDSLSKRTKLDNEMPSESSEKTGNKMADIKALQTMLMANLNSTEILEGNLYKVMEPADVCKCDAALVDDEILIKICKKSEKYNSTSVSVLGTFLFLPKLCHLPHKLSTPVIDALTHLMQHYTTEMVTTVLVPMLRFSSTLGEQHKEVLAEMVPEATTEHVTQMLSAFSSRDQLGSENDIQILQLLCQHCDHTSTASHHSVITCLNTLAGKYTSSVKFGQCLLYVAKNMTHNMKDLEGLKFIVGGHVSSLKKVIDITMRKLER